MWEDVGNLVTVPDVVGMPFHLGRRIAAEHGVTLSNPDPDGPPVGALAWPGLFYITCQRPEAGSLVTRHSSISVEIAAHGDSDDLAIRRQPDAPPARDAHATPEELGIVDLTETDRHSGRAPATRGEELRDR